MPGKASGTAIGLTLDGCLIGLTILCLKRLVLVAGLVEFEVKVIDCIVVVVGE